GLQFKKGNIQYYEDGKPRYKQIICSCGTRHTKKTKELPESLEKEKGMDIEESKDSKQEENLIGPCKAFYRFRFDKNGIMTLSTYSEAHSNHDFKIKRSELSEEMIREIHNFQKTSKVIDIKGFLENKFKVELLYSTVYKQFRKIYPLLGPEDAE